MAKRTRSPQSRAVGTATFTGGKARAWGEERAPTAGAVTLVQHHSLLRLPEWLAQFRN